MKKILTFIIMLLTISVGCNHNLETSDNEQLNHEKNERNQVEQTVEESIDLLEGSRLDESVTVDADGRKVVTNPDDLLVVLNKERSLPDDYEPEDLVIPDVPFPFEEDLEKKYMRKDAAKALEELFADAEANGLSLFAQSGYRSYERQEVVFASNIERLGEDEAKKVSAAPGQSEHQTGLSMDVTSPEVNYRLLVEFEQTREGQWVLENAHHYGFIIRYPKGKELITGYNYEPWHLRYVGKEHASFIAENDLTLEEYLSSTVPVYRKDD